MCCVLGVLRKSLWDYSHCCPCMYDTIVRVEDRLKFRSYCLLKTPLICKSNEQLQHIVCWWVIVMMEWKAKWSWVSDERTEAVAHLVEGGKPHYPPFLFVKEAFSPSLLLAPCDWHCCLIHLINNETRKKPRQPIKWILNWVWGFFRSANLLVIIGKYNSKPSIQI